MATVINNQRVLGVRMVADGTVMHNNKPAIGIREADTDVLFVDNQRVLGVEVLEADAAIHNEQSVLGAVAIEDGREMYNNRRVLPVSGSAAVPTFFVNAIDGNDGNDGLTSLTAWQTIAKVNAGSFVPGDKIGFLRGQTHSGALVLPSSGDALRQVEFIAYGFGADPIILSGAASGFVATNKQYLTLDGLDFVGSGALNAVDGVLVENTQAGNTKLPGVILKNLTISGYGANALWLAGKAGSSGFASPRITNVEAFDCCHNMINGSGTAGILVQSVVGYGALANGYCFTDVIVSGCYVHDCDGTLGDVNWTGSGIFVGECDVGLIEYSRAHDCGVNALGTVGIWTADANLVVIRFCESYNNKTTDYDGGGFDIDGGATNCTIEYCYSHGNAGSGYLLYEYGDAGLLKPFANNTVRFCVSENDGQSAQDDASGITLGAEAAIVGCAVYNNIVFQGGNSTKMCLQFDPNSGITAADFEGYVANNIFITTNGAALVYCDGVNPAAMRLRGNNYYASGTFLIHWNAGNYASLALWQAVATTQEKISAVNVGITVNPLLIAAGSGGTINAVNADLSAYKLQTTSPMIGAGLDLLALFGINPGSLDFYGVAAGAPFNVGSSYATAVPPPPTDPLSLSPAFWFDGSDPSTITDAGAGAVSQWRDKSSNANHANQATAGLRPITGTRTLNGLNVIDFDPTDDTMTFTGLSAAGGVTIFAVGMVDSLATNHSIVMGAGNGAFQFRINATSGTISILRQGQATLLTSAAAVTAGVPFIICAESSAAGSAIFLNGGAGSSNATNPAYTTTTSRVADLFDGIISDVIPYQRVLTSAEKNLVGNYLEAKSGITWGDVP